MRHFTVFILTILLSACSSQSSTIKYYLLHSPTETRTADLSQSVAVKLSKLSIPDYLKQRGMPLILDTNQVHISKTHVWAEPFDSSVKKLIEYALEPDYSLVTSQREETSAISLQIEILHLVPNAQGDVAFSAKYRIFSDDKLIVSKAYAQSYPLKSDGYSHAVDVYREAIFNLVLEIKKHIQSAQQ